MAEFKGNHTDATLRELNFLFFSRLKTLITEIKATDFAVKSFADCLSTAWTSVFTQHVARILRMVPIKSFTLVSLETQTS